ncbi:keratin, type I cytoskeletal 24-like [Macrobrachium nipponense]|uniref:keratin, type I cytoskeletal 24-like n=1 Tax=Macrobrachium nipponense TaxID=159736 RepID=UPI0030C86191
MKGSRLLLVCCLVAVASTQSSEEGEEDGGGEEGELFESDPEDTQGETRFLGGFLGGASSENNQEFDSAPGFGGGFNINPGFGGGFNTNHGFGGGFGGILGGINPGFSNSFEDPSTNFGHSFEDIDPDLSDGFGDTNPGFNDGFENINPGFSNGFEDINNPDFFSDSSEDTIGGRFGPIKSGLGAGAFGSFGPIFASFGLGSLGSCRFRCRSPQGQVYCCEDTNQFAPVIFVKPGECPPVRPSCPAVRSLDPPIHCSNDGRCSGIDKCCFDTCLQRSVCKPPIGSTGFGSFGP